MRNKSYTLLRTLEFFVSRRCCCCGNHVDDLQRFPSVCWLWCSAPVSLFCPLSGTAQSTSDCKCALSGGIHTDVKLQDLPWWHTGAEGTQCGLKVPSCGAAEVQASAGERRSGKCDEAHQKVSSWQGHGDRIQGRSCLEESLFHIAEHIPEGTDERRHGTLPVESTDSDRGTVTCATDGASCGSNRAVASSDGHEIRLHPG